MREVKLSSKNQIVVPREARKALRVKSGDKLWVVVRRGTVILLPRPRNYAKALLGIAREPYPAQYLEEERNAWE